MTAPVIFDIVWPFVNADTHKPVKAAPSNDFMTYRGYQAALYNPRGLHMGVDFPVPIGTLLIAPFDCQIVFKGSYGDLGLLVAITDHYGREWGFAHNSALGRPSVGARVAKGYPLARTGRTGRASGPHSHNYRTVGRMVGHGAWGSVPYENPRPEWLQLYYRL